MKVNLFSANNTSFGLKKGFLVDLVYDVARQKAMKTGTLKETEQLLKRIERRAAGSTLSYDGVRFKLEKGNHTRTVAKFKSVPHILQALKRVDNKLAQIDKTAKLSSIA